MRVRTHAEAQRARRARLPTRPAIPHVIRVHPWRPTPWYRRYHRAIRSRRPALKIAPAFGGGASDRLYACRENFVHAESAMRHLDTAPCLAAAHVTRTRD